MMDAPWVYNNMNIEYWVHICGSICLFNSFSLSAAKCQHISSFTASQCLWYNKRKHKASRSYSMQCKEAIMSLLCDLAIHVNGQETFFLNEKILSAYSRKLKKIIRQEKRKTQIKNSGIEIDDFPGGPDGFELVSRFCYNDGRIEISVSNVSLLHCCAVFLGMTEKVTSCNLLKQTQTFLEGMFYWSWNDILVSLKSCESFFSYADSSGLIEKLICALLAKIAQNSDANLFASSPSSPSSPDTPSGFRFSSSAKTTPDSAKPGSSSKQWWFDDLTTLPPLIIERIIKNVGAYGTENNSLILTRFLLHYLKCSIRRKGLACPKADCGGLADTAVHGVILVGKSAFSCRGLFSVLRIVSVSGPRKECRAKLERLIGGMLEQATLDDLLVSGQDRGVYDVNLVLRLIRIFVSSDDVSAQKLKKVSRLIDKYLGEISPDQNLKVSKFLGVAESLPDYARDCFDGVYRAIDIYLESHPTLSFEERSRLCRCLNYEKMSLEACKDLAKNPRIPPNIAVQALMSQQSKIPNNNSEFGNGSPVSTCSSNNSEMVRCIGVNKENLLEENQDMKMNIQKMQWRVMELEKACREMKGQMSRLVRHNVMGGSTPSHYRASPRLC